MNGWRRLGLVVCLAYSIGIVLYANSQLARQHTSTWTYWENGWTVNWANVALIGLAVPVAVWVFSEWVISGFRKREFSPLVTLITCSCCQNDSPLAAKFCSNCGHTFQAPGQPRSELPVTREVAPVPDTHQEPTILHSEKAKPNPAWLWLFGVIAILADVSILISVFAGRPPMSQYGGGMLSTHGLLFYFLWRDLGKKGWQGGLIGVFVGLFIFALAAFTAGYIGHVPSR